MNDGGDSNCTLNSIRMCCKWNLQCSRGVYSDGLKIRWLKHLILLKVSVNDSNKKYSTFYVVQVKYFKKLKFNYFKTEVGLNKAKK